MTQYDSYAPLSMKLPPFLLLALLGSTISHGQDGDISVPTTQLIEIAWKDSGGKEHNPGAGAKLSPKTRYGTIQVVGCHASISSAWWKKIFSKDTRAFASAKVKGVFGGKDVEAITVGPAKKASGKEAKLDMGFSPVIADRIPWLYDSMEIELRVSKAQNSTIDSLVDGISAVTSSVPDLTVSTSATAATSIAKAVDKMLFAPDRSVSPLHAKLQLKTNSDQLSQGIYIVLGADSADDYKKYIQSVSGKKLLWDGKTLTYGNEPIQGVSYFVVQVSVHDKFFDDPKDAINSPEPWASKFTQALQMMPEVKDPTSAEELAANIANVKARFAEGRTLIGVDTRILNSEKNIILTTIRDQTIAIINTLEKSKKDQDPVLASTLMKTGIAKRLGERVASSMMKNTGSVRNSGSSQSLYFKMLNQVALEELRLFEENP